MARPGNLKGAVELGRHAGLNAQQNADRQRSLRLGQHAQHQRTTALAEVEQRRQHAEAAVCRQHAHLRRLPDQHMNAAMGQVRPIIKLARSLGAARPLQCAAHQQTLPVPVCWIRRQHNQHLPFDGARRPRLCNLRDAQHNALACLATARLARDLAYQTHLAPGKRLNLCRPVRQQPGCVA